MGNIILILNIINKSFTVQMKALLFVALIALSYGTYVGTQEQIDQINSMQDSWVAAKNQFSGLTETEIQRFYLGTIIRPFPPMPSQEAEVIRDFITLPTSFNAVDQWPSCMHAVRDQARCGSCWAFSASEVLSDRTCIEGGDNVVLSPQDMVSCDMSNYGCQGGYLNKAWDYLHTSGIVSDACYPYTSGSGNRGTCRSSCTGSGTWKKYHSQRYSTFRDVNSIKQEVYTNGPIQTGFIVYSDFMSYHSGVYVHTHGGQLGGHAVKIVGWGTAGSTPYWIVANSWGTGWGINGYFWMGMHQCSFEQQGIAGMAQL